MAKIFDKNYSNTDLTIPAEIWNNPKINGTQKIVLTLIKRFTSNGTKTCEALTLQMSQMLHTHLKDIEYNLKQLHEKEFIEMYRDDSSRTKISIRYLYLPEEKEDQISSQLF